MIVDSDARIEQYVTIKINTRRSRRKQNGIQSQN